MTASITNRLDRLRDRIVGAGRDPADVTIVAVTKGFGVEVVEEALSAGLVELGENYAQDLREKFDELSAAQRAAARWHFIGRLQTNKVRLVAPDVVLWQSVDRASLADEIAKRAPSASVLVQVNTSGEPQKGGCTPDETSGLVARCRELGLAVHGLMCVGPAGSPDESHRAFRRLTTLADGLDLRERSMGMSEDLDIALAEGSTMVRIGTALFGSRPAQAGGHQ